MGVAGALAIFTEPLRIDVMRLLLAFIIKQELGGKVSLCTMHVASSQVLRQHMADDWYEMLWTVAFTFSRWHENEAGMRFLCWERKIGIRICVDD